MNPFRKIQYNSPVVLNFALLSLLALFLGRVTGGWTTAKLFCVSSAKRTPSTMLCVQFGNSTSATKWSGFNY